MKRTALIIAALCLVVKFNARADETSAAARDVLIYKFSKVILQLPDSDPSKINVTLRLADLLSERARAAQREELAAGCTVCKAGYDDRVKALRHYQDVLPKLTPDVAGRVMTQIGHLYQMNNEEPKAIAMYEKIIASSAPNEVKAEADFSLGELYFKKRHYEKARQYYSKVLNAQGRASKGFAAYRLAWCEFYAGNPPQAAAMAEKILSTPALLTRTASVEVVQADEQFQEEVSRDLVTFLAAAHASGAAASEKVYKFSPEKARLAHLFALAAEFERLGQKRASIEAFQFLQQKETRPNFKLEGFVRLANQQMEMKETSPALVNYEKAIQLWPEVCGAHSAFAEHCKELGVRLKNFVIDWHKVEKSQPSEGVFAAYKLYLSQFKSPDMAFQAALIAKNNKNYGEADTYFALAQAEFAKDAKNNKETVSKLEAALLSRIEVAELANDKDKLHAAWSNYLAHSIERSKALEVEYQFARASYESGDYNKAAEALKAIVFSASLGSADIREKAADLSLDALALLKDDTRIEMWAREFAAKIPKKSGEFYQIAAKAGLNKAAHLANSSSASEALQALKAIDVKNLSQEDRIQYLKNRLILAEKNQNWAEARVAANDLLAEKSLSLEDRDFALEHKAYLAELILDFKTAVAALKQQSKKVPALRLALMSELAREDATVYYRQRLAETDDAQEKVAIATKLIRDSKNPTAEWSAQRTVFAKDLNAYARLALELYARGDKKAGELLKKDKTLAATPAYKALSREALFDEYEALVKNLSGHQLDTSNERKMVASIKARGAMLIKTETLAKNALNLGDYTSQLIALDLLAKESSRFYSDLLGLPIPEGLSPEEEQQYMAMLSEQAAPHRIKAEEVNAKVKDFWAQTSVLNEIQQAYATETSEVQKILGRELRLLSSIAPTETQASLAATLSRQPAAASETVAGVATTNRIEQAREALRQDPLNVTKVEGLLSVERELGPSPMVSYLEQRLENLKKTGGKL